jgi:hypothetical protein
MYAIFVDDESCSQRQHHFVGDASYVPRFGVAVCGTFCRILATRDCREVRFGTLGTVCVDSTCIGTDGLGACVILGHFARFHLRQTTTFQHGSKKRRGLPSTSPTVTHKSRDTLIVGNAPLRHSFFQTGVWRRKYKKGQTKQWLFPPPHPRLKVAFPPRGVFLTIKVVVV